MVSPRTSRRRGDRAALAIALLLASLLWACADEAPPAVVALVQIDPDALDLEVGAAASLSAAAFDDTGRRISGRAATWESEDPSVASVDGHGEILGLAVGNTSIVATIDGKRARAKVRVIPQVVATVEIEPAEGRLLVDETLQLGAIALSSRATPIDGRAVAWTSFDPDFASVSDAGVVRGRRPGVATIAATIDGVEGIATIAVVPHVSVIRLAPDRIFVLEGESAAFTATVLGKDGSVLEDRELAWSSAEPEVAIAEGGGAVTGVRPGKAAIYAEAEGIVGMAVVEVGARPASLRLEPPSLILQAGVTAGVAAIVTDTAGIETLAERCEWSSTAPSVIRTFADGSVETLIPGEARVEARCLGLQSSVEATVLPRASLRILGPGQIPMGGSVRIEAEMGRAEPKGEVRWSVAQPDPFFAPAPARVEGDGTGAWAHGLEFDPFSEHPMWPAVVWISAQAEGRAAPRPFVAVPPFTDLQAGPYHTCGMAVPDLSIPGGTYLCWGDSRVIPTHGDRAHPVPFAHPLGVGTDDVEVVLLSAGETINYGFTDKDDLVHWGCDEGCDDHPGSGPIFDVELSKGPKFVALAAGYGVRGPGGYRAGPSCGLLGGGGVQCWNIYRSPAPFDPAAFVPAGARSQAAASQAFISVGVGAAFVCALTADGEAWCWGPGGMDAEDGGSFVAGAGAAVPAPLAGAPPFVQVAVGKYHACGLTGTGAAWCWGHSRDGALGAGFAGSSEMPVPVAGGLAFRQIDASIEHTCGVAVDGRVHCWGRGRIAPAPAPVEGTFDSVAVGAEHACALPEGGGVPVCWGDNSRFQLGTIDTW